MLVKQNPLIIHIFLNKKKKIILQGKIATSGRRILVELITRLIVSLW